MQSLGYRKVTEEELERERLATARGPLFHLDARRKLCERVTGSAGEVESCIRYMGMEVRGGMVPSVEVESHDSPESGELPAVEDIYACLRKDPNDASGLTMIVRRTC